MLLNSIFSLLIFVLSRVYSNDELCRLIELHVEENLLTYNFNEIEQRLFYKTDYLCRNKPVFRSSKYFNLYQFQSPNNRWWSLYDTTNSTYKPGMKEWCDAWNTKPIISMSLGMFQYPLRKTKRSQRWQRVFYHETNNSYTYKSIPTYFSQTINMYLDVHIKCYYHSINSLCQTHKLAFLFDLSQTTTVNEINQMKLLTKTLIWLLYNQTKFAISFYHDRFHLISSFENQTSTKTLENLYDSIDIIDKYHGKTKRFSVQWSEAIHDAATKIFHRHFLLPTNFINTTDQYQSSMNDSVEYDDDIYTEPYPLIYFDEYAIKTVLNITTHSHRDKRAIKSKYNRQNHVLIILTSRSKYLYDYTKKDKNLAKFIDSVPLRIIVIDFNKKSNKKISEYGHSTFIENAKYSLVSLPINNNYIDTYEELGDVIHSYQLFDYKHRLCSSNDNNHFMTNFTTYFIETNNNSTNVCSLLTLLFNENKNSTLNNMLQYTFYQTGDRCFSEPVYRSIVDRNLYLQKISNGQWVITHVDSHLPSLISIQTKFASTTTSNLPPELLSATDYANGPLVDDDNGTESVHIILPDSVPYCSDTPGLDIIWKTEDNFITNSYLLQTARYWTTNQNRSDLVLPVCDKYKISCHHNQYDLLFLIDLPSEYANMVLTFLDIFFKLIESSQHRFSFAVLSSTTIDTFQYHLPLESLNTYKNKVIQQLFSYTDNINNSTYLLNDHMDKLSQYLINNKETLSHKHSQQIFLTISSRLNFNENNMIKMIESHSNIRYMAINPYFKTDDGYNSEREYRLRSLTSSPSYLNLFSSYEANRDLTYNTVFRLLESLCGYFR